MKKETFIKAIEAIRKQDEHDMKSGNLLAEVYRYADPTTLLPDNHIVVNALMEVLQEETKSVSGSNCWIEYFCYELDFGKKNGQLKSYRADGSEIPLANAGELWEYLMTGDRGRETGDGRRETEDGGRVLE